MWCINNSNLALSDFSNNINSELGFGIHNNQPLRSSNIQKEQLRNTDKLDPSISLGSYLRQNPADKGHSEYHL